MTDVILFKNGHRVPSEEERRKTRAAVNSRVVAWGLPVLASSDSHFLTEIARVWSVFRMYAATFEEMALALRGLGGREVRCA